MSYDGNAPRRSLIVGARSLMQISFFNMHICPGSGCALVSASLSACHGWNETQLRGPNYSGQLSAIFIESEYFWT